MVGAVHITTTSSSTHICGKGLVEDVHPWIWSVLVASLRVLLVLQRQKSRKKYECLIQMLFLRWMPFGAYVASVMGGISSETGYVRWQGRMVDLICDGRFSAF